MSAQSHDSVPPAPAWMERNALLRSNWPVEEGGDLKLVELLAHGGDGVLELLLMGLPLGGGGSPDELDHDVQVVDLPLEGDHRQDRPLERVQLRDVLLGPLVVVPERRVAHLGLRRLYLPAFLVDVKETSTGGRRAS